MDRIAEKFWKDGLLLWRQINTLLNQMELRSFILLKTIYRTKEKDLGEIQREIQAIIRQITASVTFLPLLEESCIHLMFV